LDMTSHVAVILIGGYSKGTRFRPLSLDIPKPFFPIAGLPMIYHQLEALASLGNVKRVYLLGFYEEQLLEVLVRKAVLKFDMPIQYLKEPAELGTGGGLVHFASTLFKDNPASLIVMNGDVCSSFPLKDMMLYHCENNVNGFTIMGTQVSSNDAHRYGCIVTETGTSGRVIHYAEKPVTDVSNLINTGVYIIHPDLVKNFPQIKAQKQTNTTIMMDVPSYERDDSHRIRLERDILTSLAGEHSTNLYAYILDREVDFFRPCKNAASAIQCSQDYFNYYKQQRPELLSTSANCSCDIIGEVIIDPSAEIDPTAKIGPNVYIAAGVTIGSGVRIKNSIILEGVEIKANSFIIYSIIGWNSTIGMWSRIEGSGNVAPSQKRENEIFDDQEEIKITIFGTGVRAASEIYVLNCIVLPHKDLNSNVKNRILL
jgi:mannose-1-phosphate guanylyltransferase